MTLGTPPDLGALSSYTAIYPPSAAGRLGAYGMTLPFAGAVPLVLPGITSSGLVRIDLANILVQGLWVLDGTGAFTWTVPVPTSPAFQGLSFDVQSLDIDFNAGDFAWADNDLALSVGQGAIGQGHDMVWIPAGMFQMGSPEAIGAAPYFNQAQAQPVHPVTITQPFWVGKYEVTQAEYQVVMGSNPSSHVGAQLPVEQVSWNDAMAYCAALTASENAAGRVPAGYQYRLPTEAEWEYFYRAGTATEFWSGPSISCAQTNGYTGSGSCSLGRTSLVGSYPTNPWGLHDVAGNVWEWCLDSWDGSANYPLGAVSDPLETSGAGRVVRGGSWFSFLDPGRGALRGLKSNPGQTNIDVGFRVVLAPSLVP